MTFIKKKWHMVLTPGLLLHLLLLPLNDPGNTFNIDSRIYNPQWAKSSRKLPFYVSYLERWKSNLIQSGSHTNSILYPLRMYWTWTRTRLVHRKDNTGFKKQDYVPLGILLGVTEQISGKIPWCHINLSHDDLLHKLREISNTCTLYFPKAHTEIH